MSESGIGLEKKTKNQELESGVAVEKTDALESDSVLGVQKLERQSRGRVSEPEHTAEKIKRCSQIWEL